MDVESRRRRVFEVKDGEVVLSILGIRGDMVRGVEEDNVRP